MAQKENKKKFDTAATHGQEIILVTQVTVKGLVMLLLLLLGSQAHTYSCPETGSEFGLNVSGEEAGMGQLEASENQELVKDLVF